MEREHLREGPFCCSEQKQDPFALSRQRRKLPYHSRFVNPPPSSLPPPGRVMAGAGVDLFFRREEAEDYYDVKEKLGEGSFGAHSTISFPRIGADTDVRSLVAAAEVFRCTSKTSGNVFAVKVIDKQKAGTVLDDINEEIAIMASLEHPNVVRLYEVFDGDEYTRMIMEFVSGGEMFDRIVSRGSYTEKDAATCIGQMCSALEYMHTAGIVHRDLKPENILYASPDEDAPIKLTDFGLARVLSDKAILETACGTPGYVAPELLASAGYGVEVRLRSGWRLGRRSLASHAPASSGPVRWTCGRWASSSTFFSAVSRPSPTTSCRCSSTP